MRRSFLPAKNKPHIKSFADTRDWSLSVSGISWFFGEASLKGSSDKALTDCKLESKVLMSPTCENGRQTSANNAQIFSPRQKQTLSKRGPQLSTWRQRPLLQNAGDFGDKKWPAEAMRFENLATADSLGQSRRGNCTTRALLIRNWLLSFSGKSCFLWGLPLRKGFFWQGPDCKREEILMLPSYKNGLQTRSKHCQ